MDPSYVQIGDNRWNIAKTPIVRSLEYQISLIIFENTNTI